MACVNQTLAGLVQDCENSKGGIKKVWIATENPQPIINEGVITGFEKIVLWNEYNFKKNTSSFTSTLNIDPANGINFVTTELVLLFNKMNTVKRIEMAGLAVNEMYVKILDSNNTYWYLGMDDSVIATSGNSQSGTAKTDGNFYQITLTDESKTWPYEIKDTNYYIQFNINGGTGTTPTTMVFNSSTQKQDIGDGEPSRAGYLFCGWSSTPYYNEKRISKYKIVDPSGSASTPTGNYWSISMYATFTGGTVPEQGSPLTLYAQWYKL